MLKFPMLKRTLVLALLTGSGLAQANAVPGLDVGMYDVTDIAYEGRRGAAFPNGEAGFMIGHSWCNSGTVNVPWISQVGGLMVDQYPRIAFLLVRESGGRMVQVSGQSFCKHSPTAYNFSSGPCAPCNTGTGSFFFTGCSDTYGSGTNASQYNLGPTTEIDPWLGTWNPVGSYFDRGSPSVAGAAATDGARSLSSAQIAAFDSVKNRMIVRESELIAGATYYGQTYAMVQGEPVGARSNNAANRQISITASGNSWTATTTSASQVGSVLTQWSGCLYGTGQNGTADGRFMVAVKVTGPTAGVWHYEYAVHNIDNNRGGAALRIPMPAGATVTNTGFHDIDADALNEWVFSRTTNEVVFAAAANNALEWNAIYNCWFDSTQAPPLGPVFIDEARIGAGALSVQVDPVIPSNMAPASTTSVGIGCGGCRNSLYEFFAAASGFDLANSSLKFGFNGTNYTATRNTAVYVPATGTPLVLSDDSEVVIPLPFTLPYPGGSTTQLRVCSNGFISPFTSNGTGFTPTSAAFLSGAPRWAAAWHDFNPATIGGQVLVDASAAVVRVTFVNVANFSGGGVNTFQFQLKPSGEVSFVWQNMVAAGNAYLVGWSAGAVASDPGSLDLSTALTQPISLCASNVAAITLNASGRPALGTTVAMQTSGIPAGSPFAALVLSFVRATPAIDLTSIGMPSCFQHVVGGVNVIYVAPASSTSTSIAIPANVSYAGLEITGQSFSYSPSLTPLGMVSSNGVVLFIGP